MTVWYDFMSDTRYWELEPYFDLDGGRALALPGVEYIVYIEKPAGPIEVRLEKHGYNVKWVDPATGEATPLKDFKSERQSFDPPDTRHDWILHISREGRKEGMLKSWKFESRPFLMQEVEVAAAQDSVRDRATVSRPDLICRAAEVRSEAEARDSRDAHDDVPVDGGSALERPGISGCGYRTAGNVPIRQSPERRFAIGAERSTVWDERQWQGLPARPDLQAGAVMRILAIDTTSEFGSLALQENESLLEEMPLHASSGFSPVLYGYIDALLKKYDWPLASIDVFASAAGPGSFTGVRVGLTAAKGLADATGRGALAVSNLQALAAYGQSSVRAAVIDATKRRDLRRGL